MKKLKLANSLLAGLLITTSVNRAYANPAVLAPVAPLCATGVGTVACVFVATVVIAGVTYKIWQNTRTKERFMTDSKGNLQPEPDQYPLGSVIQYGLISPEECKQKAREAAEKYGGEWAVISPGTGISIATDEFGGGTPLHYCSIKRHK